MTPALMFLNDHLPTDDKLQLIENTTELNHYEKNERKHIEAFITANYDEIFEPITHNYPVIVSEKNSLSLKIKVPQQDITVGLQKDGHKLEGMTFLSFDEDNHVFCIDILLPGNDNYELIVYEKNILIINRNLSLRF